MERSNKKLEITDLKEVLKLAKTDVESFFKRKPQYGKYLGTEVLIALCQGAALHYLDETNGIKDFDIWFFFPDYSPRLPCRRRAKIDFGESKFGVHPEDKNRGFKGRRIDVLMRSDRHFLGISPDDELAHYLENARTETSKHLAAKAVIGLYPDNLLGKTLWPR